MWQSKLAQMMAGGATWVPPQAASLSWWFDFRESTTDKSGRGIVCNLVGSPTRDATGLALNGSTQWATVDDGADYPWGSTTSSTVMLLVNADTQVATNGAILAAHDASTGVNWYLALQVKSQADRNRWNPRTTPGVNGDVYATGQQALAGRGNGATKKGQLWRNALQVAESTAWTTAGAATGTTYIGHSPKAGAYQFKGKVLEALAWNSLALSDDEMRLVFAHFGYTP